MKGLDGTTPATLALHAPTARGLVSTVTEGVVGRERRREPKDTMATFLGKKREMFLLQMALDTKREEIQKLEAKALAREDALKSSELLLEEVGRLRGDHTDLRVFCRRGCVCRGCDGVPVCIPVLLRMFGHSRVPNVDVETLFLVKR